MLPQRGWLSGRTLLRRSSNSFWSRSFSRVLIFGCAFYILLASTRRVAPNQIIVRSALTSPFPHPYHFSLSTMIGQTISHYRLLCKNRGV